MFKKYTYYLLLGLAVISTLPVTNAHSDELTSSEYTMAIDIEVKKNGLEEKSLYKIHRLTIQKGNLNKKNKNIKLFKVMQNIKESKDRLIEIAIEDKQGNLLYREPLIYPNLITVPPAEPGKGKDFISKVILPNEIKTTLIIPYFNTAYSMSILEYGKKIFSDSDFILNAISKFNLEKLSYYESYKSTQNNALESELLNFLIISSGYDSANMWRFQSKASEIKNTFLSQEPFKSLSSNIAVNIYNNLMDTGCYSGCYNIDRLMCCDSDKVIRIAESSGYSYDEIIVVHNTNIYSGGGMREYGDDYKLNSYSTYCQVYDGPYTTEMVLHELGHSFGNLCDEYTYSSEQYTYSPCVNCRSSCDDWSNMNLSCQMSCDAVASFYRPEDSIMFTYGLGFNQPSIKSTLFPDGLEKRLRFFININNNLKLSGLTNQGNIYYTVNLINWSWIPGILRKMIVSDLNSDGKADLAGLTEVGNIYYTTDLGAWRTIPGALAQMVTGDLTGDGKADLAGLASNGQIFYTTDLVAWRNIPGVLGQLLSDDLNGDGKADLAGLTSAGQIFYTTNLSTWNYIPGILAKFVIGDLNGDGKADLAGLTNAGQIFYTTDLVTWRNIPGVLNQMIIGDLNGDGKADLAGLTNAGQIFYTTDLVTWRNIPGVLNQMIIGDLNGDGKADLAGLTNAGQIFYTTDLVTWRNIPGVLSQLVTL